jgi:hypothetical protein
LQIIPPEEAVWAKLYVLQSDRCDWPDVFNLVYAAGPGMNWNHLLERLADDTPFLAGALSVFAWLSPGRAKELPDWLWGRLKIGKPEAQNGLEFMHERANRLDTRAWYIPTLSEGV